MKFLVSEKLSPHKYKTAEGYLVCVDAVLARTGKQSYMRDEVFGDGDESIIEIDRTPEEVFSEATLASFENKPITVEHPNEDVNSENVKEYSVGFVRDVHRGVVDGQDVILGTLVIQDAQTIEEIENGEHTDLSCGYDCDIQDEENPQQRNIRGNHVALCAEGRAGNAKIMDSRKGLLDMSQKCVICGETFDGYGNNAEPVKKGICCDVCNIKYVIPARINKMHDSKKVKDGWSLQQIKNLVNSYNSTVVAHDKINGYYISSASAYEIADIARKLNIPNQYSYEADGYFIDLAKVGIKDSKKVKDKLSSSYRIIETLPNGYGIAQTYGDGLFYIFKDDEVLYGSYAFLENAKEALNRYKNIKDDYKEDLFMEATLNVYEKDIRKEMEKGLSKQEAIQKILRQRPGIKESLLKAASRIQDEETTGEEVTKNLEKNFENFKEDRMEDNKCKDSLTTEEIDLVNYAIKNLEHNNDADQLIKAMSVYYSKYADLAKEKPEEVKEYFRQHVNDSKSNDSKLYSITWKQGNKIMKSTLVSDSMTAAIAKFQKYIQVRGIKDAMVDIEGIKKVVDQVRKVKKLKGDK